jgi:hypothetical protein
MDQVQNTYMLQQGDAKVLNSKFDGYNNIANMLQAGVNDNTRSNVVRGLSLSRVEDRVQQIQDINNAQTRDITTIAGINQTQMSSLNDLAVKDRDQDAMVSMVGLYNTVHSAGIDNMNDKTTRAASKLDSIDANNIKTATLNMIQGLQLSDLYKRVLGGG